MTAIETRIAAGLERAFAEKGFAEPNVEALRDAAGVSLRTLYKYAPSRDAMIRTALEHRHRRYIAHMFDDLPEATDLALSAIVERIADWMKQEAAHGCLFHAAVAAAPYDRDLRALLQRHKSEVARRAAEATGLAERETDLMLIIEGLTQSWPLLGDAAVESARRLGLGLRSAA
ncbi:TetR/AcrR family transcriptional regulator [Hoeflea sp.]|uniref:TetR/AcrR family transcriptional regulator n=1 Tax=Hoeflea sp. TaxID=1940281 RepID=UPI003A9221E5